MARLTTPRKSFSSNMRLASARRLLTTTHGRVASAVTRLLWFRPPPGPTHQISRVIRLSRRSDLPRRLHPQRLYLIGTPEKWAIFRCPCGTGHQIDLNLAHPGRSRWSVTLDPERRPSLRPSIDVRATRRCHFWLTNGQVRWCQDTR